MSTIQHHGSEWIGSVAAARQPATAETYRNALQSFYLTLAKDKIVPARHDVDRLTVKHIGAFIADLHGKAISTEKVYLTAVKKFYTFLNAEELTEFNMDKVDYLIKERGRRPGVRYPSFPEDEINRVIDNISTIPLSPTKTARLRDLRDIALILTLADTGLRIHEACNLKRGDLAADRSAVVIGKGDKQAKIFFTRRSARAINQYLRARLEFDGQTGRPLSSLPLFARHDKAIGRKIEKITPQAGRDIIEKRVVQVLGEKHGITPHKFRHAFVTAILKKSGGNLKLAQELARHSNIQATSGYAHLTEDDLRDGHRKVFDE